MRKTLAVSILLILLAGTARAQISSRVAARFQEFTFAAKPAAPAAGTRITITDCLTTACAAGGGTVRADLRWTGSAYEIIAVVGSGGTPGGADTHVQVNDAGVFFGEAGFTYNKTTNVLTFPTPFTLGATSVTSTGVQFNYLNALTGTSGSGTTLIFGTFTSPATGDVMTYSGGNWVNSYVGLDTNPQAGAIYAIVTGDKDKLVLRTHTTTMADTIAQAGTAGFPDQWSTLIRNDDTVDAYTVTAATSAICTDAGCGSSVLTLNPGDSARLVSNGTNYIATVYRAFTRSGNSQTVGSTTGTLTSGRCVEIDASGNFIQAAAACAGSASVIVNKQDVLAPVTLVDGATDTTLYTTTVAGATIVASQCLEVWTQFRHTTGTGSVTYKIFYGAASNTLFQGGSTSTVPMQAEVLICNNNGVTNAQTINQTSLVYAAGALGVDVGTAAENSAAAVVLKVTASGANTEAVTPQIWLVKKVQ